jgi:outer membrane lipoprotein-sorting protein
MNNFCTYKKAVGCYFIVITSLLPSFGYGKELSIEGLKQIQTQLKTSEFLTVDFQEDVYKALRNRHDIKAGTAYFHKPSSFRWVVTKPKKAIEWIFNGKELLSLEPGESVAKKFGVGNAQGRELRRLVDMVMNMDALLMHFKVKKAEDMGGSILVDLLPKGEDQILSAALTIDREKNFVSGMKLNYADGAYTSFTFTNPRMGAIDPALFLVPKGMKIRDEM